MSMKRFLIASAILSLTASTALASPAGKTTVSLSWTPHASQAWSQSWDFPYGAGVGQVRGSDSGSGLGLSISHQEWANDLLGWEVGARIGRGTSEVNRYAVYQYLSPTYTTAISSPLSQRVRYEEIRGGLELQPNANFSAGIALSLGRLSLKTQSQPAAINGSTSRTALRPIFYALLGGSWGSLSARYAQQAWLMPSTRTWNPSPLSSYPGYAAPRRLRLRYWTLPNAWGSIGITAAIYRPDVSQPIFNTGHRLAVTYESPNRNLDIEVGRVTGYQRSQPTYSTPGLPALVAAVSPMAPWRAYASGLYASATVRLQQWQLEALVMAEPGQAGSEHTQAVFDPRYGVTENLKTSTTLSGGTYLALRMSYTW